MIKIRMARGGRVHKPIYSIVATDSRSSRDGRFLEKLGQYNPASEEVLLDVRPEAIAAWIEKGAVLSDTVKTLLKKHKIDIKLK